MSIFVPHAVRSVNERVNMYWEAMSEQKLKEVKHKQSIYDSTAKSNNGKYSHNTKSGGNRIPNKDRLKIDEIFPPSPLSEHDKEVIIRDFCNATSASCIEEAGCAVCGSLVLKSDLVPLKDANCNLYILSQNTNGFTRMQQFSSADPIKDISGPVINNTCDYICKTCKSSVQRGKKPKFSLARGLWLGQMPKELQDLQYFE